MSKRKWVGFAVPVLIVVAAYFINVEVQSYLGRKAIAASGLNIHTLAEAKALASQENKQILANLSAIWCPSCRSFDKTVLSDETVQTAIQNKYVFARIEYESEAGEIFRERFDVSGFPRLFILDANGDMIRPVATIRDPDQFRAQL